MFLKARGLSSQAEGLIAINAAAVIFGLAALYGKLDVSPFWIVAMRSGFAAITLALLARFKNKPSISSASWGIIAMSGLLLATHWLTFFASVQLAGVAVATLTFATFPLFTVLVEAVLRRRLPRLAEVGVGFLIIIAVALLTGPGNGQGNIKGAVIGLSSAVTYALFWQVSQGLNRSLAPVTISFYQNAAAFLWFAPTLLFATPAPASGFDWLCLAALGVINTALMFQLYLYALKRISATTCSGFIALEPVYAIIFAGLLFQEPITPWIIVSIFLIVGASLALLKIEQEPMPPGVE
jgi:drug/metabolite transporter (DMT)-like permease